MREGALNPDPPPRPPGNRTPAAPAPPLPKTPAETRPRAARRPVAPDWMDGGRASGNLVELEGPTRFLVEDAKRQYDRLTERPTPTMRNTIYGEFAHFAASVGSEAAEDVTHCQSFWAHKGDPDSPIRDDLEAFRDAYCHQVTTFYLHKIRFIAVLAEAMGRPLDEARLMSPNSLVNDIFEKGGSTELNCLSLKINNYSWFRPSSAGRDCVARLAGPLARTTVSEMAELCNHAQRPARGGGPPGALAHGAFGRFLGGLLTDYPPWLDADEDERPRRGAAKGAGLLLNTKFAGRLLGDLFTSHWLAAEGSAGRAPDRLVCPGFFDDDTPAGHLVNLCSELQFLTRLVAVARARGTDGVRLICRTMREKYDAARTRPVGQKNLPFADERREDLLYGRIVLHLPDLGKNPHRALTAQVAHHKDELARGGAMFVLSDQRLLVPSHADRTRQLLKDFRLRTIFDLRNLKGKGDVPDHLYVLTKREDVAPPFADPTFTSMKEPVLTFGVSGSLSSPGDFGRVADGLGRFLSTKRPCSTPIHRNEIAPGLVLEFHQDSVIDGKHLSIVNDREGNVTHTRFLKNLMESYTTFDRFFLAEPLDHQKCFDLTSDLLEPQHPYQNKYLYVLVVNLNSPAGVSLDVINSKAYMARVEKYGTAHFRYYGLTAKIPDLNVNVFREFFHTTIGSQIIKLSLDGQPSKLRSKVNSLLVPKLFAHTRLPSATVQERLAFLRTEASELPRIHPDGLKAAFAECADVLGSLKERYPWYVLGLGVHFKNNCRLALERMEGGAERTLDYGNPLVIERIGKLDTRPLLGNQDVHVEFRVRGRDDLDQPLGSAALARSDGRPCLELRPPASGGGDGAAALCVLHAEKELVHFTAHILQAAKGLPVSSVLRALHVPRTGDLRRALRSCHALWDALEDVREGARGIVSDIFVRQVFQGAPDAERALEGPGPAPQESSAPEPPAPEPPAPEPSVM